MSGNLQSHEHPLVLEINANNRYKAGEMGVIEFRACNRGAWKIPALEITVECPCELSGRKSRSIKNLASESDKSVSFRFEPGRGGAALLEIEISCLGQDGLPLVLRGHKSITVASREEARPGPTSLHVDIHDLVHDLGALQRTDLSNLISLGMPGREEEGAKARADSGEPNWIPIELDLDDQETAKRRDKARRILLVPAGPAPSRIRRGLLECLDPTIPRRIYIYSTPEIRFGRNTQKNDAVLRFLPDFYRDERSKTISGGQFLARYSEGQCILMLAPGAHAPMSLDGRLVAQNEKLAMTAGSELKIGTHDFGLRIETATRSENPHWLHSRDEIARSDPGDDPFRASRWDCVVFSRTSNGPEEEYVWLLQQAGLSWDASGASGFRIGRTDEPGARVSFWNGRYYLEIVNPAAEVEAGSRPLRLGDIACLGSATEISFGSCRFSWKPL